MALFSSKSWFFINITVYIAGTFWGIQSSQNASLESFCGLIFRGRLFLTIAPMHSWASAYRFYFTGLIFIEWQQTAKIETLENFPLNSVLVLIVSPIKYTLYLLRMQYKYSIVLYIQDKITCSKWEFSSNVSLFLTSEKWKSSQLATKLLHGPTFLCLDTVFFLFVSMQHH